MPTALLGAVSCGRCAHAQRGGDTCDRCGAGWVPPGAASASGSERSFLAGVVHASRSRCNLTHLLDWSGPLVLVALAVAGTTGALDLGLPVSLLVGAAVGLVLAQLLALTLHGRSLGRWLLRQRTVDDLTGTPVRPGQLVRRLGRPGRVRVLTADLRRGRDPVDPQLAAPVVGVPTVPDQLTPLPVATIGAPPAPGSSASVTSSPSVGIVLESGERYEIHDSLLIGRSPVDPVAGADRPVLAWPDLSRRLAKTHVLLEWSGTHVWLTDLNSVTGTVVVTPAGDRQPLTPGLRTRASIGSLVVCGGRSIKVVPHG